jgi:hypothetical protein
MSKQKLKFDHSKSTIPEAFELNKKEAAEICNYIVVLAHNGKKETENLQAIYEKYNSAAEVIFSIYAFARSSFLSELNSKLHNLADNFLLSLGRD